MALSVVITGMGDCLWAGMPPWYVTISHPGQFSLAIPPWVGAVSAGEWCRLPLGKKQHFVHNSRPCYQDCWHTDLRSYAGFIGSSLAGSKHCKRGWTPLQWTIAVYAKCSISFLLTSKRTSQWHSRTNRMYSDNNTQNCCWSSISINYTHVSHSRYNMAVFRLAYS